MKLRVAAFKKNWSWHGFIVWLITTIMLTAAFDYVSEVQYKKSVKGICYDIGKCVKSNK